MTTEEQQELAQRAVLEALKAKIKHLGGFGKLSEGATLELEFWGDLFNPFPNVFERFTAMDVVSAISKAVEPNQHLVLENIAPFIKYLPNDWSVPVPPYKPGKYLTDEDILLSWKIRYSKVSLKKEVPTLPNHISQSPAQDTPEKTGGDPFLFYLSRTKGLYRIFREHDEIYPVHKSNFRFQILDALTKDFQKTGELAKVVGITTAKLRPQIAGVRKQIDKKFKGLTGKDFIEGEQNIGYRIGQKITLKK